jgi:beta-galactosidase GanA
MKRHGMTSVGIMMDWELIEPAEGQFDFRKFDPITAIQGESPHVV